MVNPKMIQHTIFIQQSHWKYSSKQILTFAHQTDLAWQNMHSLQLYVRASLYEMLFAYVFTAHGQFLNEMWDGDLSQLSTNRLLRTKWCKLFFRNVHKHSCFLCKLHCSDRTPKCSSIEHTNIHWSIYLPSIGDVIADFLAMPSWRMMFVWVFFAMSRFSVAD